MLPLCGGLRGAAFHPWGPEGIASFLIPVCLGPQTSALQSPLAVSRVPWLASFWASVSPSLCLGTLEMLSGSVKCWSPYTLIQAHADKCRPGSRGCGDRSESGRLSGDVHLELTLCSSAPRLFGYF